MTTLLETPGALPRPRRSPVGIAADRLSDAGAATVAGAAAGLVALGLGSRLAMRVLALTSGRIGTGLRPESGAIPGTVTADGTGFLLLAGTFAGAAIGVVVAAGLGRWLPAPPRARWLAAASLASVLPAIGLLDPGNDDFRHFGPTWLAVGLFTAVVVAFGLLFASLTPRLQRRWRGGPVALGLRILAGTGGLLVALAATVGLGTEAVALAWVPPLVLGGAAAGPVPARRPWARRADAVAGGAVATLAIAAAVAVAWRVVAVLASA